MGKEEDEKTVYFKVEGVVYAESESDARVYLYELLAGKCDRFKISVEEE